MPCEEALATCSSFPLSPYPHTLQTPVDGQYSFKLDCDDECSLFVDGRTVLAAEGTSGLVNLTSSQHSFMVGHACPLACMQLKDARYGRAHTVSGEEYWLGARCAECRK